MTLRWWLEVLSAIGYGVLSSIIPIFHTEAFIIASQASKVLDPIPMSIGLAVGSTIGKQLMFLGVRHGRKMRFIKERKLKEVPPDSWRGRWRRWSEKSARLVEDPKWGFPLLFISSATGLPPVYPVVLVAGATKMNFWWFSLVLTIGFFIRCLALALMTLGVVRLW